MAKIKTLSLEDSLTIDVPSDGRQSERALDVRRGVGRFLRHWNFTYVTELTLPNGRRADLVALGPKGEIWIVEIKSSVADFQADTKWSDYLDYCDRFFFATLPDVPVQIFPIDTGLLVSDHYGAEIVREASETTLKSATRKSLTFRLARFASATLHSHLDPQWSEKSVV